MVYYDEDSDIMDAFFKGKVSINDLSGPSKPKIVELGDGKGIGHKEGSYGEYVKRLSEQASKGNGIISIGKSVIIDNGMPSIKDLTDKFIVGDIPNILIMYYNVINPISIKVTWKDSNDDVISEQYYEIQSPQTMQYDWWDQYEMHFMGPEDLEEGDYKVEIMSTEFSTKNNKKTLSTSIEFIVTESEKDSQQRQKDS